MQRFFLLKEPKIKIWKIQRTLSRSINCISTRFRPIQRYKAREKTKKEKVAYISRDYHVPNLILFLRILGLPSTNYSSGVNILPHSLLLRYTSSTQPIHRLQPAHKKKPLIGKGLAWWPVPASPVRLNGANALQFLMFPRYFRRPNDSSNTRPLMLGQIHPSMSELYSMVLWPGLVSLLDHC